MTYDGCEGGGHLDAGGVGEESGEQNGYNGFAHIQQQDGGRRAFAHGPEHIGCACAATTILPYVHASDNTSGDYAEWHGA
jgi:hypothetical protein